MESPPALGPVAKYVAPALLKGLGAEPGVGNAGPEAGSTAPTVGTTPCKGAAPDADPRGSVVGVGTAADAPAAASEPATDGLAAIGP